MKSILSKFILSIFFCKVFVTIGYGQLYEWRGPERNGIYNESGLLEKWPEEGPELLWEAWNMGDGYSSPTVTDNAVYVTGRKDSSDVLTALTLDGKKKWETVYGKAWERDRLFEKVTCATCLPEQVFGKYRVIVV